MYAQLGNIVFDGLKGFTSFNRKHAATLAKHALIDRKPKIQKTGDELEELSIDMTFHKSFCVPETEIRNLVTAKSDGAIMPLILGTGELIGNYVIQDITESVKHSGPTGVTIYSTVNVNLVEYVDDDELSTAQAEAKNEAFANDANAPLKLRPLQPSAGAGLVSVKSIQRAGYSQATGATALQKAGNPAQAANEMRKAKDAFNDVNSSMQDLQSNITNLQNDINNVNGIITAAEAVKTAANNAVTAIAANDLPGAIAASNSTLNSINGLQYESSNLVALTAARRI